MRSVVWDNIAEAGIDTKVGKVYQDQNEIKTTVYLHCILREADLELTGKDEQVLRSLTPCGLWSACVDCLMTAQYILGMIVPAMIFCC